ncbi:MAG: type I-E CRISPR-associated protein Cas5/CasD [Alphaproteobacteria bacterium]|nr:type I-E CRISPR-associated protein Cas5/CasD [Alphaproteobacteria bacterium]
MPERQFLLLGIEGPLMSFGGVVVDELGPTRIFPTLSAITGMLGNALGWQHWDGLKLQRLQSRLSLACRLDRSGRVLTDFQTTSHDRDEAAWTTRGIPVSRKATNGPTIRNRQYLADAAFTVAVTLAPSEEDGQPTLIDLAAALERPARPLFFGRKGCFPAEPIGRGIVVGETFRAVLLRDAPFGLTRLWLPDGEPDAADGQPMTVADLRDWPCNVMAGSRVVRELLIEHRRDAG